MFVIKRMKEGTALYLKNMSKGFQSYTTSLAEAQKFSKKESAETIGKGLKDDVTVVDLANE